MFSQQKNPERYETKNYRSQARKRFGQNFKWQVQWANKIVPSVNIATHKQFMLVPIWPHHLPSKHDKHLEKHTKHTKSSNYPFQHSLLDLGTLISPWCRHGTMRIRAALNRHGPPERYHEATTGFKVASYHATFTLEVITGTSQHKIPYGTPKAAEQLKLLHGFIFCRVHFPVYLGMIPYIRCMRYVLCNYVYICIFYIYTYKICLDCRHAAYTYVKYSVYIYRFIGIESSFWTPGWSGLMGFCSTCWRSLALIQIFLFEIAMVKKWWWYSTDASEIPRPTTAWMVLKCR